MTAPARSRASCPDHVTEAVARLVATHENLFSTAMAAGVGMNTTDLALAVKHGALQRITRGWYMVPDRNADPKEQHRRLALAVQQRTGKSVISHDSALVVHGIATFMPDLERVHLTQRGRAGHRSTRDCVFHRGDVTTRHLPNNAITVAPEFAVVTAGLRNPLAGLVAADSATHQGKTTLERIEKATTATRGKHGWYAWEATLPLADPRAESPPETIAHYALTVLGEEVEPQVEIVTDQGLCLVDLLCRKRKLAIEVDGSVKYAGAASPSGRPSDKVVMDEKTREAALVRAGWRVLRLTWKEIVTGYGEVRYDNLKALVNRA